MRILVVGRDPMILSSRCSILQSAGHAAVPATSTAESLEILQNTNFDLVLLCHSFPAEDRDQLTSTVRASGSHIPIYTVAACSIDTSRGLTDGLLSSSPKDLINQVIQAGRQSEALVDSLR